MKRVWAFLLAALLLFGGAVCAQALEMQVSRADGIGAPVKVWEKSDGQKYLFLPAYMADQTLVLEYSGADSVCVNELPLSSGGQTDIITGGMKLTAKAGKKTESVIVMASENLPAVHLTTKHHGKQSEYNTACLPAKACKSKTAPSFRKNVFS